MASVRQSVLVVDGVRSRLRTSGPPASDDAGEAVVFVHGNPGSGADWLDLMAEVGEFARALAPDMPGYGQADRPASFPYTVSGYGHHLGRMLDQLGVQRAHLVLHDFGGPWGMCWASEHPERVASLVLCNIGALPGYRWHKYARIWRTPILGELFQLGATRTSTRLLLRRDNPRPLPEAFIDRMLADADWPMKRAVLKLYRATDLGAVTERLGQQLKPHWLPTLVIWGEEDPYLPVQYARLQRDYFDAEVHILPSTGHWPMVDDPKRVARLVVPFLRQRLKLG